MPNREAQLFSISTWTMVRFVAIILIIAGLYLVRDIVFSLFLAIVVASAIEPAIMWLKERHIPRLAGVILIYLCAALFLFFLLYLIIPLVFDELTGLTQTYPNLQDRVLSGIEDARQLPFSSYIAENLEDALRVPQQYLDTIGGGVADFVGAVFGGIFAFILMVMFSFYLAAQEKGIDSFLRMVSPLSYEPYAIDLWHRSQKKLGRWFRAQLLLGAIVGILIFFGLTILGIRHAFVFAILAGMFEIIPVAGPILAAVPAVAVALLTSPVLALFTALLYFLVQQIESNVIIPVVMRQALGLSPLIVVIAILIGAKLGGLMGIIISVPLTVILAEFLDDWDRKKRELIPG